MKKLLWATSLLLLSITTVNAQKNPSFEGIVVYDMSFDGSGLPQEALAMFKGSTITMYVKGDKRRADTKTPMSTASTLIDEKNKTVISLMDMMGKKYMIKMSGEALQKELDNTPVPVINYSDEAKTIAGINVKKQKLP